MGSNMTLSFEQLFGLKHHNSNCFTAMFGLMSSTGETTGFLCRSAHWGLQSLEKNVIYRIFQKWRGMEGRIPKMEDEVRSLKAFLEMEMF